MSISPEALATMSESELRGFKVPWPKTEDELVAIVRAVTEREHDYGTCVYAMSIAATSAFNYIASKLGVTGFQASCADMDVLRRTRGYEGPFRIFDGASLCYPQYDFHADLAKWIEECQPWVSEQCQSKLDEYSSMAADAVVSHWRDQVAKGGAK